MSRLSRFKKAPAVRLPKKLPPPSTLDEDSDDDDDFITRRKPIKYKDLPTPKSKEKTTRVEREPESSSLGEASTSEYFRQSTNEVALNKQPSSLKVDEKKVSPELFNGTKEKSISAPRNKAKVKETKESTSSNASPLKEVTPSEDDSDNGRENSGGKVLCPICWKKLGDKLSATTHVKACAKNVPIQQVMEAMQLQQKQVEEWDKLGLAFPGFAAVSNNNNGKKTKSAGGTGTSRARTGGGGRGRKKTAQIITEDPELELAVALSMSLHEELESRQSKENQFLIENGLEKEIGLVEVKPTISTAPMDSQNQTKSRQASEAPLALKVPTAPAVSRRRGKKIQLNELPLYVVNDEKKKAIICERVTKILDEPEKDKGQEFYISNKIPSHEIGVPKRLAQFQNKECTLWTRAQATLDVPNESFSVLDLPDPKEKLKMTCPGSDGANEFQSTDNSFAESDNKESPTDVGVAKISKPSQRPVTKKDKTNVELPAANTKTDKTHVELSATVSTAKKVKTLVELPASAVAKTCATTSSSSARSSIASHSIETIRKLPRLIQDIVELLMHKKECDMTLYGREEKPIRCHSFMLLARCPRLLGDVVEEKCGKRNRRVIPLTNYGHKTVKAFLWYVYTGQIDNAYDDELLEELKDLTSTYGISIHDPDEERNSEAATVSYCSVEVQTEIVATGDSSTMTETLERCSVETGFDSFEEYKASQELFTTLNTELEASYPHEFKHKSPAKKETFQLADMIENRTKQEHDDNEEAVYSDVDLFEDIENEMNKDKPVQSPQSVDDSILASTPPVKFDCASTEKISVPSPHPAEESDSQEEFWNELHSPSSSWKNSQRKSSYDKKRLRSYSPSPLVGDSNEMYTATQNGNIVDMHYAGGNGNAQEYISKAIKKQKLDCDTEYDNVNDDCEMQVDNLNVESGDTSVKWCDDDDVLFNISYNNVNCESGLITPKRNLLKSRRSVSTPNLSIIVDIDQKTHESPFDNQQNSDNELDPFGDACDDSVFAKIPDEVLMKVKTPKIGNGNGTSHPLRYATASACASQKSSTPISHTRRRLSPRNLSRCEDEESLSTTTRKGNNSKGRGNGKAKPPPKIRLPTKKQQSNRNGSEHEYNNLTGETFQSQPQPHPLVASTSSNCKSPMLNYSLIDTPILKQELKKFGIKPLPRSKAKVLLRHIYKETHK